jgi:hypothetical protein
LGESRENKRNKSRFKDEIEAKKNSITIDSDYIWLPG